MAGKEGGSGAAPLSLADRVAAALEIKFTEYQKTMGGKDPLQVARELGAFADTHAKIVKAQIAEVQRELAKAKAKAKAGPRRRGGGCGGLCRRCGRRRQHEGCR